MTADTTATPAAGSVEPPSIVAAAGFGYFPIALTARLPYAMMVIGVLTLVVSARGSLGFAGLASAMVGLGAAVVGPLVGAAADRFGQRRVLLATGICNSAALLLMAAVVFSSLPGAAVLATAVLVGASAPQVGPMSRSRLVGLVTRLLPAKRHARTVSGVMAYESAADETIFVFGPVIVGLLATTVNPAAPMIGAAILTLVFVSAFALHRTGAQQPDRGAGGAVVQAPAAELRRPRLMVVVLGVLGVGLFFGSSLTAVTAVLEDLGTPEQAGLYYGIMGIGSATLALACAWLPARFTHGARWLTFALTLLAGAVLIAAAGSLTGTVVGLAVAGIGVGPTLVTEFSLAAERSPMGRSATVMTILGSAIIVGQSAASALNGLAAEELGTAAAQLAPALSAGVVVLAGAVNLLLGRADRRRARGADRRRAPGHGPGRAVGAERGRRVP